MNWVKSRSAFAGATCRTSLQVSGQIGRSSNLRIKKQFTDVDKDRFRHEGFEYISKFFENSIVKLVERNPGVDLSFRRIDANHFKAAAYRGGEKVCKGSASIGGGMMGAESIASSMTDEPRHGGMNEAVSVKADAFWCRAAATLWVFTISQPRFGYGRDDGVRRALRQWFLRACWKPLW